MVDGLKIYISNPVIAWDNNNKFKHFADGETNSKELGYVVS